MLMLCHSFNRLPFFGVNITCKVLQFSFSIVTSQFLFCLIKVLILLFLYVELLYYRFCYKIDNIQEILYVANFGKREENLCKLGYYDIIFLGKRALTTFNAFHFRIAMTFVECFVDLSDLCKAGMMLILLFFFYYV